MLLQHKTHQMGLGPGGLDAEVSSLHEQFSASDKEPDYILSVPGEAEWLPDSLLQMGLVTA